MNDDLTRQTKAIRTACARAAMAGRELYVTEVDGQESFVLRHAGSTTLQFANLDDLDDHLRRLEARRGRAVLSLVKQASE